MPRQVADGTYRDVIILGAKVNGIMPSRALRARIDVAADYAKRHPHVRLIATGGQGPDEGMAEGAVIRRELIARGIEADRIQSETTSTSTIENFAHSQSMWEGQPGVTVVTSDFHVNRARLIASLYFKLNTDALYAPTPRAQRGKYVLREGLAYIKLWVLYAKKRIR